MATPDTRYERKKLFEQILQRIEPLLNEGRLEEANLQLSRAKEIDPDSVIVRHLEERVQRLQESLQPEQSEESFDEDQSLQLARLKYEQEAQRLEDQRRRMEEAKRRFEEESRLFEEQRHIVEEERIKYEVDRIKKERDAQKLSELRRRADIERRKYEEEVRKYEEQSFLGQESRFKFEEELRKREERKKQMLAEQRRHTAKVKKSPPPSSQSPQPPPIESEPTRRTTDAYPPLQPEPPEKKREREYLKPITEEPTRREALTIPPAVKKTSREEERVSYEQPITYRKQKSGKKKAVVITLTLVIFAVGTGLAYYLSILTESPTLTVNLAPPALKVTPPTQTKTEQPPLQQQELPQLAKVDTIIQSFFQQPETAPHIESSTKQTVDTPTPETTSTPFSTQELSKEAEKVELPAEKQPKEALTEKLQTATPPQPKETGFPIEEEDPTLEQTGELTLHTVKAGETIESISRQYKVTIRQIMKWNGLTSPKVKPKQELYVFIRKR